MAPAVTLSWNGFDWEAEGVLASWAGFRIQGVKPTRKRSTGKVEISVLTPENEHVVPDPAQLAAWKHLRAHEAKVTAAVLDRVWKAYPKIRKQYGEHAPPALANKDGLADVICLAKVHVLPVVKAKHAYVGLEMRCSWDGEHGLGAMVHKDRVVGFGGADHAILEWIGERDGGRMLELDLDEA